MKITDFVTSKLLLLFPEILNFWKIFNPTKELWRWHYTLIGHSSLIKFNAVDIGAAYKHLKCVYCKSPNKRPWRLFVQQIRTPGVY